LTSYADNGYISCGIGHNLTAGRNRYSIQYKVGQYYTPHQIEAYFRDDLINALYFARKGIWNFDNLPDEAKFVTISLIWTVGGEGFMKFKNFRLAMSRKMYNLAAMELKDSRWAKQLPIRAENHIKRLQKIS